MTLLHHVVFGVAVAALGGASWRLASWAAPAGLERVLATAVVAAGLAILEELALGAVSAGGSAWAGAVAAGVTWGLAWRLAPVPSIRARDEAARWWRARSAGERALLGAAAGAFAVSAVWVLYRPAIGFDNTLYHYTEVLAWVHNGRPGSIVEVSYDYPVGSYPLANEVLLTWGAALARSFAPMALWGIGAWVLCGLGLWSIARTLRLPGVAAAGLLGLGLGLPWVMGNLNEPGTEVPALAWTLCAAALALAARRRPVLLSPALLAAGLALGTKTTPVVVVVAVLAGALWASRARLRDLRVPLGVGAAAGLAVSLPWYLRTWVHHGSPFWPFGLLPGSDPRPPQYQLLETRFIERPIDSLTADFSMWRVQLAGGLLVAVAALVAPLISPRREVALASGLFALGLLVWMTTATTGLPRDPAVFVPEAVPVVATRYLLSALLAGGLALALAAREPGWRGWAASAILVAAALWCWATDVFRIGEPYLPAAGVLGAGALVGAAGAYVARGAWRLRAVPAVAAVLCVTLVGSAGAAVVGRNYVERHIRTLETTDAQLRTPFESATPGGQSVLEWFASQPRWLRGDEPISFATRYEIVVLTGSRLRHRTELMPAHAPCSQLRRRAYGGWAVVSEPGFAHGFVGVRDYDGFDCFQGLPPAYAARNFTVYRLDGR